MNLARRVSKLERILTKKDLPRIVLRFEGSDREDMAQPTDDQKDENTEIHIIRFVGGENGSLSRTL